MNARSRFSQSAIPNAHRMWPIQKDRGARKVRVFFIIFFAQSAQLAVQHIVQASGGSGEAGGAEGRQQAVLVRWSSPCQRAVVVRWSSPCQQAVVVRGRLGEMELSVSAGRLGEMELSVSAGRC